MKRIILFRFHKDIAVCRNRLKLLKLFNPEIKIYGLFGGTKRNWLKMSKALKDYLDHSYMIPVKSPNWRWKNADLAIRLWYRDYGNKLEFDMLHLVEWDLLLFDNLDNIYSNVPKDGLGLSGLVPIQKIQEKWDWVSKPPYKNEWISLMNFAKRVYGYNSFPYGCIFPGTCLSKKFIAKFSKAKIPEL
ncbi:MAG: hypothetical protein KGH71_05135, partial [Candidatus Micrarchaeota archaeon]|nr:hypothetical protein [Candidatus Micrarchaeota archaeon]